MNTVKDILIKKTQNTVRERVNVTISGGITQTYSGVISLVETQTSGDWSVVIHFKDAKAEIYSINSVVNCESYS